MSVSLRARSHRGRLDIWVESESHTGEEAEGKLLTLEGRYSSSEVTEQQANYPAYTLSGERTVRGRDPKSYMMLPMVKSLGKGYDRACFQDTKVILFDWNTECGRKEWMCVIVKDTHTPVAPFTSLKALWKTREWCNSLTLWVPQVPSSCIILQFLDLWSQLLLISETLTENALQGSRSHAHRPYFKSQESTYWEFRDLLSSVTCCQIICPCFGCFRTM